MAFVVLVSDHNPANTVLIAAIPDIAVYASLQGLNLRQTLLEIGPVLHYNLDAQVL